jgi:hypothetical protein
MYFNILAYTIIQGMGKRELLPAQMDAQNSCDTRDNYRWKNIATI